MDYSILISAASAVIAASAFIIALLNYRIGRKMPNENKLFEEKIKSYRTVVTALNMAAAVYIEKSTDYHYFNKSDQTKSKDDFDEELTTAYYLMEDTIHEQMLLLPDDVIESIDVYFELFAQEDFLEEISKKGKTEEWEEKLNSVFDDVINAMREDMAFEKLNKGLKRRIGSRTLVKKNEP